MSEERNKGGAPKGNQNARGARFRAALERELARLGEVGNRTTEAGLERIAASLVKAALEGESWAIQEIANRIDGKPAQSVELTGDESRPIMLGIVKLVRPD